MEKEKEKVYCIRCQFYIDGGMCHHQKNIKYKHTPTEKITIYGNVYKLNKYNNCKKHQPVITE